jgi:hypothetical protein
MYLLSAVREGEVWGEPGKALLAEFIHQVDDGIPRREMLEYLREAFRDSLNGMSIDKALGLVQRRRGNPGEDQDNKVDIAAAIWRLRMNGESLEESLDTVTKKFKCSERTAAYAWSKHKLQGWVRYRLSGILYNAPPWTEEVMRRARKIAGRNLGDQLWQNWLDSRTTSKKNSLGKGG